jgi:mono/diheme cytochrome c family protein
MKTSTVVMFTAICAACSAAYGREGSDSWDLVERGSYLAVLGDCTACHTATDGKPFAGGVVIDTPFGKLVGANITPDTETGLGRWNFENFQDVMSRGHGIGGKRLYGAMPYTAYTKVSRQDNQAMWAYLQTLEPVKNEVETNQLPFPFNQRLSLIGWNWLNFSEGEFKSNSEKSAAWNRGAYLVQGLGHCGTCHSPKGLTGGDKADQFLQGANLQGWVAPNITSDPHRGIGAWSEDDLVQYLKTGANRFDIASGPMGEAVEHSTQHWREEDLRAVSTYLKDMGQAYPPPPEPVAADSTAMRNGKAIYADRCSGCHTPSGEGIAGLFPKLAGAPLINSDDPSPIVRAVLGGSRAISTQAAPTGPSMPAFAWNLSDQNVADVATYVRNSWTNAAPAVSANDVQNLREDLGPHP